MFNMVSAPLSDMTKARVISALALGLFNAASIAALSGVPVAAIEAYACSEGAIDAALAMSLSLTGRSVVQ